MPRFVMEIGTEELPPRFLPPALAQLREDGARMFERARLSHGELEAYGTPRRLTLIADDLAACQASHTREERGPAARVAFDGEGKPTKAALGFASRHGLPVEQLVARETEQGAYVFAVVREPELPAAEALARLLPELIAGLSFPKTMRWGTGKLRFGRPVRWLLALVDGAVVECEIDGVQSGRSFRGHPVLADGMHELADAGEYERALEKRFVLVDSKRRREAVEAQLDRLAQGEQARLVADGLVEDTTFLVEWPTAAAGAFDPQFLMLPRPILIDEMQHVQSYFPLEDERGELLSRFIAVRDGGEDHLDVVVRGWESVLRAKLIDARFFYEQDLKMPLGERVEALKGVVFQERLGTMWDKVERVRAIAAEAAAQAGLVAEDCRKLDRAALLCKADLTTEVVAELSSLQGAMGREYALRSGEDPQVAEAIGEHYRPRFAGDATPGTPLGRLLALADKLDTLASLFAVGVVPTGSTDPFGLRREAYGVVNILIPAGDPASGDEGPAFSVSRLIDASLAALRGQVDLDRSDEETRSAVLDFIRDRVAVYLRERGIRYDLVEAALAPGIDDLHLAWKRAEALSALQTGPEFLPTVVACTRPMNIAKGFEGGDVRPALLQEDAERALWAAYLEVAGRADSVPLRELFGLIAARLVEPIDRFFTDVLVMHEDEALRRNRLALCWQISQLLRRIADFPLVVQT